MKTKLYSIRDLKDGTYSAPFLATNDAVACRQITIAANGQGSLLNSYPEDFTLAEVGIYDSDIGITTSSSEHPRFVTALTSLFSRPEASHDGTGEAR